MRNRADRWKAQAYPFGSEMPWDSTGQEEVYAWTRYFGYLDKADVTLNGGTLASGAGGGLGFIAGNVVAGSGAHTIATGGIGTIGTFTIGVLTSSTSLV
jgi:hypothetical protein